MNNQATPEQSLTFWTLPGRKSLPSALGLGIVVVVVGLVQYKPLQFYLACWATKSITQITDLYHSCPIFSHSTHQLLLVRLTPQDSSDFTSCEPPRADDPASSPPLHSSTTSSNKHNLNQPEAKLPSNKGQRLFSLVLFRDFSRVSM